MTFYLSSPIEYIDPFHATQIVIIVTIMVKLLIFPLRLSNIAIKIFTTLWFVVLDVFNRKKFFRYGFWVKKKHIFQIEYSNFISKR